MVLALILEPSIGSRYQRVGGHLTRTREVDHQFHVKVPLLALWIASHNPGARSGHNLPRDFTFASLALVLFRPPGTPQGQG